MYDKMRKNIKKERIMEDSAQKNQIKETVNQLYALRAGLSLVDKEHDKASEAENATNSKKEKFTLSILGYTQKNEQNETGLKGLAQKEADFLSNINVIKENAKKKRLISCVCGTICILSALIAFITYSTDELLSAMFLVIAIPNLIVTIINVVGMIRRMVAIKNLETEFIQKFKTSKEHLAQINNFNEQIKNNNLAIEKLQQEMDSYISSATKEIAAFSQKGVEMYSLVAEEFSKSLPSLDQRDYKHVDLIIYLLETGRAETMKEALQQVDSYVSTDRIVQEISKASKTISQSITINMQSIRASIESSMYGLGEKIDRLTYNVNELNNNQINNAKIQNALLEKANVSSSQMAKNIEQMRKYADEAYIKNANKW